MFVSSTKLIAWGVLKQDAFDEISEQVPNIVSNTNSRTTDGTGAVSSHFVPILFFLSQQKVEIA